MALLVAPALGPRAPFQSCGGGGGVSLKRLGEPAGAFVPPRRVHAGAALSSLKRTSRVYNVAPKIEYNLTGDCARTPANRAQRACLCARNGRGRLNSAPRLVALAWLDFGARIWLAAAPS
mgnify:CR=1 FL=1